MKNLLLALVASIALAGCAQFDTQTKQVQAVCATATTAISVLADHADKLTDGQKAAALEAVAAITPVCGQGEAPTYDTVKLAAVQAAIDKLTSLQGGLK